MCDVIKIRDHATLYCDVPGIGHEWHYDAEEDVTWRSGPPPAEQPRLRVTEVSGAAPRVLCARR